MESNRITLPKRTYTFTNGGGLDVPSVWKFKGTLDGSGVLAKGSGLPKGNSILGSGGGLAGTSLFEIKHYDTHGYSSDDDVKHPPPEGKYDGSQYS